MMFNDAGLYFLVKKLISSRFLGQKFALFFNLLSRKRLFCFAHVIFSMCIYIYIYIYTCKTSGESYGREKYFLLFFFTGKLKNERERVQSIAHVRIVSFAEPKSIHSASDYHRMILRGKINISLFYVSFEYFFLRLFCFAIYLFSFFEIQNEVAAYFVCIA